MIKLTNKQIDDTFGMIKEYHEKYLQKQGVHLPALKRGNSYTKDALTLVYLAYGYPKTRVITKSELTEFIQQYYPKINDVQQARHLAAQKGWYILSGTRGDSTSNGLKAGEYQLRSLEAFYPGFTSQRRADSLGGDGWEALKKEYGYCCACCGSKEGKPHRYWKNIITELQRGHKDPRKPLELGNVIPQCSVCNRPDRNYWIYDDKGRVVGISNAKVIDRCSLEVKKEIYERLRAEFGK